MLVTVEQPSSKSKAISAAVLEDFGTTATLSDSDSTIVENPSDSSPSPSLRSTVITENTVAMTVTTKATSNPENTTFLRQSDKKPRYGFLSSLLNNNGSSLSLSSISSVSDTSSKKQTESGSKYKLFKPWGNSQDSEYKTIEKAFARFQSKNRHKVAVLKTTVIPWLKKYTIVNTTDKGMQRGRLILLKWWNILVENLTNTTYTDRSLYFECILSLMTRNEYEEFDRIGSINQMEDADAEIPIETVNSYRTALMTTLHYAIDRLNQKGVYSNVISFCARVLALCFFKIPGVGFALLHALPVNKFHIRRILREAVGDDNSSTDQISKQNDKIAPLFPEHLRIICFSNLQTWRRQFENAKRMWGEPPIEMNGNWIRRWQSDDSELFFSFYKHYHVVLKSYLATHLATLADSKSMTPPYQYITSPGYIHLASIFLLKIESLVNRSIHIITTVIQFEHSKNIQNSVSAVSGVSSEMNSNAVDTYATTGIGNSTIVNGDIANTNVNISGFGGGGNGDKPKVLEVAEKRFVETMVSIAENGVFQEMCNVWIKAVIKKTNMYDVEGVFCKRLDKSHSLLIVHDDRGIYFIRRIYRFAGFRQ